MFRRTILRFILNIFPPLLFNRIILKKISADYSTFIVHVNKSILNMNFHKTIFGGTIFSAFDPYLPVMYYNIFHQKKRILDIWVKGATIKYKIPSNSNLNIRFNLSKEEILEAENQLNKIGKFEKSHTLEAINKDGIVCVEVEILIYLKDRTIKN
tara:strand:+ start:691 stop:1155 length:465 start_codon:yes stop_codon:yes gene_type:complete